jgi:hypothetical protein
MHPDLMMNIARQRSDQMRSQARDAALARGMRKAGRARRSGNGDAAVLPAVPDYVPETFEDARVGHPAS